ncbi:hypothetical protein BKA82DRAFT_4011345 [Pisolithus tinctorius]|nr:hypothetical protein BKA82DRAFT_4011345 [Pisolithus tinctorius]
MATSSMLGHIPALCKWAMTGAWIMAGSWNIHLASFHARNSKQGPIPVECKYARIEDKLVVLAGPDPMLLPGTGRGPRPVTVGWHQFLTNSSWPEWITPSRLFTVVQKAFQWDSIGPVYVPAKSMGQHRFRAVGSCLASILNQLQLAGMDDTLWAIYSGSEGTPVGFYWASICSGQIQSAGSNSQLLTMTWDTYQPQCMVQKALQWDSIGPVYVPAKSMGWHRSRAGSSCLASVLNQLQLARMDDTLWAIYSGSEGTPVGCYWASICSGKVQSAGPNSQLVTITWDTYWPYARGLGQMPSLGWLIGMDAQLRPLDVTGLDDGLVFWHPLVNA